MYLIQHSRPMFSLEELFCNLDDFCNWFEPQWESHLLSQGLKRRSRRRQLSLSEIMTILISFHRSYYRNFKHYYLAHICVYWKSEFPKLPSYNRASSMLPERSSGHAKRVCRVDAFYSVTIMRLSQTLFWQMHGN